MNVTIKTLPKSEVTLTIEVTPEQMVKFREKATKQISSQVKIPGFRPGHAPYEVLKDHINEEAVEGYMLDIALPETYSAAVLQEKIQAVSRPKINILEKNPLKYEATVAIYPSVKISGYDKLDIKKQEVKAEEKDVDEVLANVQKKHATHKAVDREAKTGDKVEVDFEGFDEGGASLEKTKSSNHPLVIGEGSLVKGFEDELIGMKVGEKKSFKVKFPKDYFHKPFQDKNVEFKVDMKKIEEVVLPEWTPEFIKTLLGEDKTLDEIKALTRENLQHDKEHAEKVRRENDFLEEVVKLVEVDTPEALIEEELDSMIEEFARELQEAGITLEKYVEETKKEIKALRDERRKEAEKRLKLRFGLQQIFEQEKLDVTPEDLQKEVDHILALYPAKEQYKLKNEYEEGSYLRRRLENKLKMEKLFEKFLGHARA